jgi:hypothetical protein
VELSEEDRLSAMPNETGRGEVMLPMLLRSLYSVSSKRICNFQWIGYKATVDQSVGWRKYTPGKKDGFFRVIAIFPR